MNEIQGETVSKMNPEVKAKWVAALRSGDYAQTVDRLKDGCGYCCLGVLCDLYAKERGIREWDSEALGNCGDEEPGLAVRSWAGLESSNPVVTYGDGKVAALSVLNDGGGESLRRHTFAEIADAIEAQL